MTQEPKTTLELDDERYQRWRRLEWMGERAGMLLIALTVIAALLGLLGPGPLSYRVKESADGNLTVEHYAIERYAASAEIVVRFQRTLSEMSSVRLGLSRTFTDRISVESITPQPVATEMQDHRLVYSFPAANLNDEGLIIVRYKYEEVGSVDYTVALVDGPSAQVSQFVLP